MTSDWVLQQHVASCLTLPEAEELLGVCLAMLDESCGPSCVSGEAGAAVVLAPCESMGSEVMSGRLLDQAERLLGKGLQQGVVQFLT